MASDGEFYAASKAGTDVPQKRRGRKTSKKAKKLPVDPAPSENIFLPPTEVSDEELEELLTDAPEIEGSTDVEIVQQAIELLGHRLNKIDHRKQTFEEHTLEANTRSRRDFNNQLAAEKEARNALEKQVETLTRAMEAMSAELKMLREAMQQGRLANPVMGRECLIEVPKPPTFAGARDAQEVENFLWHLEKYFRANNVDSDDMKIDATTLYLDDMALLWWRRIDADIASRQCTIETWDQFKTEFKNAFCPNNVVQDARRRLSELRQTGSMKDYVKQFTALKLQIPDLPDSHLLFQFTNGLQN